MIETEHSRLETIAQRLTKPIAVADRRRARLHLLDWLGCVAGARSAAVVRAIKRTEPDAAMRAAWAGNVLEMDDVHRTALLHPGPVVWPTALVAALAAGADMDVLLDAGVRGYEAAIAIGSTFDAHHYAHHHNTATAGGFGAAAAAASVAGLSKEGIADALGHAGSVAGGLWSMRHEPNGTKQFHIAHCVRTGLAAAAAAEAGVRGVRRVLEGPQGLYAASCHSPADLVLGQVWRMREVSFKPWAACRHAHPAIDAALALRDRSDATGPALVETYGDAVTFCDRADPTSVLEAKFSIQHAVAVALLRGPPRLEDFNEDAILDPVIAARRKTITVRAVPEFDAVFPAHFGAAVTISDIRVSFADAYGDPERPMDEAALIAKASALMASTIAPHAEAAVRIALEGEDPAALKTILEQWL
jgi:2-methylcitrate dehydratase PrpD